LPLTRRQLLEYWWTLPVVATGGFFTWLGVRAARIKFLKDDVPPAVFVDSPPHRAAALADFRKDWDHRDLDYPLGPGRNLPVTLMRTPEAEDGGLEAGGGHFLALSRVCTHLGCICQFVPNAEAAAMMYNYRPDPPGPVLGCACHQSAFDPARGGKSVSGPALKPLPRLRLEARGEEIWITGTERT
jgi:arsenite oxidase small subunit